MPANPLRTGLRCPSCRQPVAVIEDKIPHKTLFCWCPACNHRWLVDEPGTKPH